MNVASSTTYAPARRDVGSRGSLDAPDAAAVVVAGGAVEALLLHCLATAGRGDVLVGTPAYGALLSAPEVAGRSVASETTVASGTLLELIATLALEHGGALLQRVTAAAQANRAHLDDFVAGHGGGDRWRPPLDGLVAFPALSTHGGIDELLARLRTREVGMVPGGLFVEPDRIRVGLGGSPELFDEALLRLGGALTA